MQAKLSTATATETVDRLTVYLRRIDAVLDARLPATDQQPIRLHEAMRYAVTAGGKRIRPLLAYGAGEALALSADRIDPIACSLELVHAYSLVHDDLPAMDDDDMRRGQPTCHIAFDEAVAILAGDALQALAFEIIAAAPDGGTLVVDLARACGSLGMAGGQAIDLAAVGQRLELAQLQRMHALKTGALIRAALRMPALAAGASAAAVNAFDRFGEHLGLAFQIKDDILDIEGESGVTGKPQGSDLARNKPTFPALLGLEESKRLAGELFTESLCCLDQIDGDTRLLRHLAHYIVERNS